MPPDSPASPEDVIGTRLATIGRRRQLSGALRALTAGALGAACVALATAALGRWSPASRLLVLGIAAAVVATMIWRSRSEWTGSAVAALVESRLPDSQNVVFTARELLATTHSTRGWMRRRVLDAAAAVLTRADERAIVPLKRDVLWATAAGAVLATTLWASHAVNPRRSTSVGAAGDRPGAAVATGAAIVSVTITPPAYTGAAPRTITQPEALEVLQGSRVAIDIGASGEWSIRFGSRPLESSAASGHVRAELMPTESGYFALERAGGETERRLLPITVQPDRSPSVKIESPARDLLLPAPRGAIPVRMSASDDFGLAGLELRYTKVTGSGEQFAFVEGSLPLSIARDNGRVWAGTGTFDLAKLGLEPGDSLVYRAEARDRRPGAEGVAASDTFFIEVAGPGQVALPGFELPPDQERYALSQQMIVLKLQRLRAREAALSREALAQEVDTLAAEQRAVRANFIFLMGGHVEDEEEEAAQSTEIQEGRLENSARREITIAIRFMGQTEQALAAVDTGAALPPAKSAVEALQRAFGRNRYFLKTLAVRSQLDPSRRLTGELKEASGWRRTVQPASADTQTRDARVLLSQLLDLLSDDGTPHASAAAAIAPMAERALAIDPASADWQRISTGFTNLRDALAGKRSADDLRQTVRAVVAPLTVAAKRGAVAASEAPGADDGLRSAWAGEARKR